MCLPEDEQVQQAVLGCVADRAVSLTAGRGSGQGSTAGGAERNLRLLTQDSDFFPNVLQGSSLSCLGNPHQHETEHNMLVYLK